MKKLVCLGSIFSVFALSSPSWSQSVARQLFGAGYAAMTAGDWDACISNYEKGFLIDDSVVQARYEVGLCYMARRRSADLVAARQAFQAAAAAPGEIGAKARDALQRLGRVTSSLPNTMIGLSNGREIFRCTFENRFTQTWDGNSGDRDFPHPPRRGSTSGSFVAVSDGSDVTVSELNYDSASLQNRSYYSINPSSEVIDFKLEYRTEAGPRIVDLRVTKNGGALSGSAEYKNSITVERSENLLGQLYRSNETSTYNTQARWSGRCTRQ